DSLGLAIDAVSETANDVHEALSKARQMYETGLVNVSIKDDNGHTIDGDELFACITGKTTITDDLQPRCGRCPPSVLSLRASMIVKPSLSPPRIPGIWFPACSMNSLMTRTICSSY